MNHKILKIVFICQLIFLLAFSFVTKAQENDIISDTEIGNIKTSSESSHNRFAPGDFLPISVKLLNFGSQKRVDVIIDYKISDRNGNDIYSESETVAVETTASFIKRIHIPYDIAPGNYTIKSILNYPYQEDPAISKFEIIIERKMGGLFIGDLLFYSGVSILSLLTVIILFFLFKDWNKRKPLAMYDYSNKPKDQMIYYEILSDILSQMRLRIGDDAIEIAKNIPDLKINEKTGMIIDIKKEPAKIIASLVSNYEKIYGQRISFGLRQRINQ